MTARYQGRALRPNPATFARVPHVDTCGVHFPRRTSEAEALLIPVASTISESFTVASLGRICLRNN